MNIAIFTDTYLPFVNEVAMSTFTLKTVLQKHGHSVLVVTPRTDEGQCELVDDILYIPGHPANNVYGSRTTSVYSADAMKIINEFKPEIIHNHTDGSVGSFARIVAHELKIPYVYTFHFTFEDYSAYSENFSERMTKRSHRRKSRKESIKSTEIIVPSAKIKQYLRFSNSDAYLNVIPTGVDIDLFKNYHLKKEDRDNFFVEHGIKEGTKIFVSLGRLLKEKNLFETITYFADYVNKGNYESVLMIVGEGNQKEELIKQCESLGVKSHVLFLGKHPYEDMPFYLSLADVYITNSRNESQNLPIYEAIASRLVVLVRYDLNYDDTIKDGETGFYFLDSDTFIKRANHIFCLTKEEKNKVLDNAEKVLVNYSLDAFYERTMEVYDRAKKKYW